VGAGRLNENGNPRWWLAAGLFAGLALLSKFTSVTLAPAVLAFALVPDWRRRWLFSPYPWAAALVAVAVIWNYQHDWAQFRFQFVRVVATGKLSLRTLGEFVGLQLGLVGFVLLPVVLWGVTLTAWRGYTKREPVAILLSTAMLMPFLYFCWRSLTLRVGEPGRCSSGPPDSPLRHKSGGAAARRLAGVGYPVDAWVGEDGRDLRHRLSRRRVLLLCRGALESDRPDRSGRRRCRLRTGRGAGA
jgi:Dolichyl-phosphate-mannose-protein mannosyltransferase